MNARNRICGRIACTNSENLVRSSDSHGGESMYTAVMLASISALLVSLPDRSPPGVAVLPDFVIQLTRNRHVRLLDGKQILEMRADSVIGGRFVNIYVHLSDGDQTTTTFEAVEAEFRLEPGTKKLQMWGRECKCIRCVGGKSEEVLQAQELAIPFDKVWTKAAR